MHPQESASESSEAITDRRSSLRRPVVYRLDVMDSSAAPIGFLVDLSPGGMRIRARSDFDVSHLDELRICFPHWLDLGEFVTVYGRVAWRKELDNGKADGGFVFEGLSRTTRRTIEALIEAIVDAALEDGQL